MLTPSDPIKLLPANVDQPVHCNAASNDETRAKDVGYADNAFEQNDLSNQIDSECPYIRVGTEYYREVLRPQANGTTCKCLVYWKASIIKTDYGKDYLNDVPKYDCFCTVPSHTNYRKIIGNAYNLYEPITHQPMSTASSPAATSPRSGQNKNRRQRFAPMNQDCRIIGANLFLHPRTSYYLMLKNILSDLFVPQI